jgi:isoprenylcysteine carboxyl methyltransferase (ICMT) family protein YpbQ
MDILLFLVAYGLACYRITQLIVLEDGPFNLSIHTRALLIRNAHRNFIINMFAELFQCKYCMGIWVAFLLFLLPFPIALVFAIAGVQSLIETILDRE